MAFLSSVICHPSSPYPLLYFRPYPQIAVGLDLDVDHVRPAADGAVLDVLLHMTGGEVDRHDDLLAALAADVSGFVVHAPSIGR